MWNDNAFTRTLNLKYPIIQAGMAGGTTTPELVAAVSNAGGLGTLGAGYMAAEEMQQAIQRIKALTDKPFAVNLFVPETPMMTQDALDQANALLRPFREALALSEPNVTEPTSDVFDKQMAIIQEEDVSICSFTFGLPTHAIVRQLKQNNVTLIGTATTVKEALMNEARGMDMVVMQGSEAGGHRGTFADASRHALIGTMSLVPQTVGHVSIPVIAAGGIMDGRGVLAALTLGAQAVQMGTAFVTTLESGAKQQHIKAILDSTEDETIVTPVFSGKPARGIENDFISQMSPFEQELPAYPILNTLTKSIRAEAAKQNRPEWMHLWSGQSPRLSKRQSVSKLFTDIDAQIHLIESGK